MTQAEYFALDDQWCALEFARLETANANKRTAIMAKQAVIEALLDESDWENGTVSRALKEKR